MATRGVWKRGWTEATARGTMPSSAQANISRETPSSIAGRSFASATAAPATIATGHAAGRRAPSSAAARGVVPQRLVPHRRPGDRVVHGAGEQDVEDRHDPDRRSRWRAAASGRVARLAARLGDGVEPDEAGEEQRRGGGDRPRPRRRGGGPASGAAALPGPEDESRPR